jgi:enoyl-CoA hydratase/carnithine racemase
MSGALIRIEGAAGRITLDRPQSLNALTHGMVREIHRTLDAWRNDRSVTRVVIDGAGERAFCGGGDIRYLYEHGRSDPASCRAFWRDEYRLNAAIARYPKPYIALMNGIVMGGGIGVSAHGSRRIVSDDSLLAMPEVSIGFLPDVGGSLLLARAPGALGPYLGLTASRFGAADAIRAGFADRFVPKRALPDLVAALVAGKPVDAAIASCAADPGPATLAARQAEIDASFGAETLEQVLSRLAALRDNPKAEGAAASFASAALSAIARHAPLSVACAFEAIRRARGFATLEQALRLEYRFAWRSLEHGDFYEGIRAAIISRDTPPAWKPATLAEVPAAQVAAMLAPLGADELTFDRTDKEVAT